MERGQQSQDIYVMQNEHGLIKIGRSIDPEKRRRVLETAYACGIRIVVVLRHQGDREEAIHMALAEHHIAGEWFEGHDLARANIQALLDVEMRWPFALDQEAADDWLTGFFDRRDWRSIEKEYQRFFASSMLKASPPFWGIDSRIWRLHQVSQTGQWVVTHVGRNGSDVVLTSRCPQTKRIVAVPRYSLDLEASMALWPDDARPASWDGEPLACAVAALRVRLARMRQAFKETKRVPRA